MSATGKTSSAPAGSELRSRLSLVLIAAVLVAGCGSSGNGNENDPLEPPASTTLPSVAAGQGVVILVGDVERFTVKSCTDAPAKGDSPEATQQFRLVGEGKADDVRFAVTITRYSSDTGVGSPTITETALVGSGPSDAEKGLVAKRTSIKQKWLDLNQPGASEPLISRRGQLVEVAAMFGPDGSRAGDKGIVPGRIRARCP